jgi:hypothetical protein
MDYTVMVEWREGSEESGTLDGWFITVKTYHEIGDCRSAYGHKWQKLVRSVYDGDWRDYKKYPSGSIRDRWKAAQRQAIAKGEEG